MSWLINKEKFEKSPNSYHKEAKEDMIVYKIGYCIEGVFLPYRTWKKNKYKAKDYNWSLSLDSYIDSLYNLCIDTGYHSFTGDCFCTIMELNDLYLLITSFKKRFSDEGKIHYPLDGFSINLKECCIGKFIIPNGTEYYINDDGEVVSSDIIWTGAVCNVDKLKLDKYRQLNDLYYVLENK